MSDDPMFIIVVLAILAVLVVLLLGLGGFASGGEFNKKYSNRLMRYRIIAQFIAVLLIVGFIWLRGGTG